MVYVGCVVKGKIRNIIQLISLLVFTCLCLYLYFLRLFGVVFSYGLGCLCFGAIVALTSVLLFVFFSTRLLFRAGYRL
jgi:hypothetical protein